MCEEEVLGDVTNLSAAEVRRKRERERYASLSADEKEARLQKNRDYRRRKREATTGTLSRGVSRETTRILSKPRTDIDNTGKSTKNNTN
uniref:IBB domain-containing protein n=1 Tax=Leersia perrieri TaxID=77586 RepID=A0A0D9XR06_9ORYZ